jgi:hypothetical protein
MRVRVASVVIIALLAGACGRGGVENVATRDDPSSTTAVAAELPITYNSGSERFDPPGDVTAKMTADEAYAAWKKTSGEPPNDSPQIVFALYTQFGTGKMLDNGLTQPPHVRQPVWLIRFQNVPIPQRFGPGGPAPMPGQTTVKTTPPTSQLGDYVGAIDDATGQSVFNMVGGRADNPPAAMRSPTGHDPAQTSCPQDLSQYKAGMFDDGGTPDPGNWSKVTMPRAVIRASDGDVYQVWGGAGSIEHPLGGPAEEWPDGVLVVMRVPADGCKTWRDDEGSIVFHHEPSASGQVTLLSIGGDVVRYRTARGTTGAYNVVTEKFAA